jgi:hypothetical protein
MGTSQTGSLEYLALYVTNFINHYLVPFVFAIAFAMFLFGVFRFFFVKGEDPKARAEGRGYIIGAIVAFAVMVSVWGLVNIVIGTIPGLNKNQPGLPTFDSQKGGTQTNVDQNGFLPAPAPAVDQNGVLPAPATDDLKGLY